MYFLLGMGMVAIIIWAAGLFADFPPQLLSGILIVSHLLVLTYATVALRMDKYYERLAYLVGLAWVLEHMHRHIDFFDGLYRTGDVVNDALIAMVYIGMPVGLILFPIVSLMPVYRYYGARLRQAL